MYRFNRRQYFVGQIHFIVIFVGHIPADSF
jgi:hypothetical protein